MVFPRKGVRFIAINGGVDSAQGDSELSVLKNVFNEWMVKDTSKKIKAVFRSKGMSGKPLTSQPPYGYVKDENGMFVIDPETAPVVKQIFSLCLAGTGPTKIARMLTEQNIPTPGTMEYRRTGSTRRYYPDYPCQWSTNTVMGIIHRHTSFEELTPTLLREFVEKIVVHESTAKDGKRRGRLRRQEIEIYYSFVGKVELPES